ncbi:MAG TPA: PASTA domain-containing protein [Candidatus Eisenbacteria bacterium]|jgi:serine/threonine-protein kinase
MTPRRRLKTRYERPGESEPRWRPAETEPEAAPVPTSGTAFPVPPASTTVVAPPEASSEEFAATEVPSGTPAASPVGEPEPATATPAASDAGSPASSAEHFEATTRHRLSAFWLMSGLAIAAFGTGLVVFNSLVMPRLIHGIGEVRVPDVRSLTLEQAEQALRPLDLQVSRAGERFDPAVPRGFVLSQDPAPGTAVRGRKRVSVVVSLGEEFSSVPELFGESQRSAEGLLRSAGLRLGVITRAPSEEVGEGLVAGSDPGPETVLPHDSPVSLLVSTGAGEESFVMPDLVGREVSSARRQLDALGFRVLTTPGAGSIGTVVTQSPAPGSRITRTTTIQLQATGRMIR